MPDPAKPFAGRQSDPDGVGPYRFAVGTDFGSGSLAAGESATLDLREYTENGTSGYYTVLSEAGYDSLEVENRDGSNTLEVEVNENWNLGVPPNTIQSLGQSGMYRFTVTNTGSTAISAGDVVVEILKEPYNADDSARRRLREPAVRGIVRKFTGV